MIFTAKYFAGGRQRQRRRSSDESTSSDCTTSDFDTDSDDSELRNLHEGFNKDNPFTVPKIVVQPNSPVPGAVTNGANGVKPGVPDSKYVSQQVPLGASAFSTGLYQPSLSSMTKYQYKTPSLPSQQQQPSTQYRY